MDQSTAPLGHGYRVMVDPSPDALDGRTPPPPPNRVQDVRRFPVPVTFGSGHALRTVMIDGSPWFVARDVCVVLGLGHVPTAVQRLDDDEYQQVSSTVVSNDSQPGVGAQRLSLVSEAGLYSLIMGSRKAEAREFKRWVTHEVLPAIRKTGAYALQRELSRRELLEIALEAEKARERIAAENIGLRQELVHLEGDRRSITEANVQARQLLSRAEGALTEARPKVEGYEQFLTSEGNYTLATAAQAVGMGRQEFIAKLAEYGGIIVRPGHSDHLRPYQQHVKAGRFTVKIRTFTVEKDGQPEIRSEGTTNVTPKGLDWFRAKRREGGSLTRSAEPAATA